MKASKSPPSGSSKFMRSCIGCRTRENPADLLRVVCTAGKLLPDVHRNFPGRGAWVHRRCAVRAVERGAFRRAFRQNDLLDDSELLAHLNNNEMDAKDMTLK